jgi:hypothetical protein
VGITASEPLGSINRIWPALAHTLGHLIIDTSLWAKPNLSHSFSSLVVHPSELGVIQSAFAWVISSSGTWGSFLLRVSCYSWWLPPPRLLGAAEELWHELVIIRGHSRLWLWGVLGLIPRWSTKRHSSGMLVTCVPSSCVGSYGTLV